MNLNFQGIINFFNVNLFVSCNSAPVNAGERLNRQGISIGITCLYFGLSACLLVKGEKSPKTNGILN